MFNNKDLSIQILEQESVINSSNEIGYTNIQNSMIKFADIEDTKTTIQYVENHIRDLKEKDIREAIISCGYLPEQVIEDRINNARLELRNLYLEPSGITQYILIDKVRRKTFLLMEHVPSMQFDFKWKTYHNKEILYFYHK